MSVTSGFFNSLNGDRRYSAEQFSAILNGLINDGVFANIGATFSVTAGTNNTITVGTGRAWFNGIWVYNDTTLPMSLSSSEILLDRIDALVIEINHNDAVRAGSIQFVYGEPAVSPERPTLVNSDEVHQHPLAYIYRASGSESVTQGDITNMVGTSECPFVTGILEVTDVDQLLAQWNLQFGVWFDSLQVSLEGDVAANLANQILELDSKFDTLEREKTLYGTLQDSTGAAIQDSSNTDIKTRTIMGGGGEQTVIVNQIVQQRGAPVVGSYPGLFGTPTTTFQRVDIELGFRPRAVLVVSVEGRVGYRDSYTYYYGGMAIDGQAMTNSDNDELIEITHTGFYVRSGTSGNDRSYVATGLHFYLAWPPTGSDLA